jgi:hypothetical protein
MQNKGTGPDGREHFEELPESAIEETEKPMHGGYRRVMTVGVLFDSCEYSWEAVWKAGKKLGRQTA